MTDMELTREGGVAEIEHMFRPHMDNPLMAKLYESAHARMKANEEGDGS